MLFKGEILKLLFSLRERVNKIYNHIVKFFIGKIKKFKSIKEKSSKIKLSLM